MMEDQTMKGRILLVDDNEAFLDSTKDVLEDQGYEVFTAESGEEAVRVFGAYTFDVILMDIKMPGMNGVESFIEMKRLRPRVKVIMITAYGVEEMIRQALAEGALAVLHKPLDMTLFFRTIDEARKGGRGGFILVAEDDEALCDNLVDVLGVAGYQIVVAHNGEEAVEMAEAYPFDVLLLDMKLPLLNGLEVYRCIKPIQPNIVTIVITGYAQEMADLIQEILDETAQTCLTKPLDMAQLLGLLKEISAASGDEIQCKPGGYQS